jgi:hypothetical protein
MLGPTFLLGKKRKLFVILVALLLLMMLVTLTSLMILDIDQPPFLDHLAVPDEPDASDPPVH